MSHTAPNAVQRLRDRLRAANPVPPSYDWLFDPDLIRRLTTSTEVVIGDDDIEDAEPVERVARKASVPGNVTPELLTIDQAAVYLNVTDDQVAAFVRDGTLDYINVGRGSKRPRIRFTKQDLDQFIEQRKRREVFCRSTSTKSRRSTTTPSKSVVVGFTARRDAQLARKPKPSKP